MTRTTASSKIAPASPLEFSTSTDFFRTNFKERGKQQLSLRYYSQKMGYKSPRLVEMVSQGKRIASADFLFRSKLFFKMTDAEFLYLTVMTQRDRAAARGKTVAPFEASLESLRFRNQNPTEIDAAIFQTISEWQYVVLKQMFKERRGLTVAQIGSRLKNKLSPKQIEESIATLQKLGFLKIDAEGFKTVSDQGFYTAVDIPSNAIRLHHTQMMARAQEALSEVSVLEREFASLTFTLDPRRLEELKKELRRFRDRIDEKFSADGASAVYQFNLQLFPHTKED